MANAATITFGFDGVEVEQGLNRLSQSTKKLTNDVASASSKVAAAGTALDRVGSGSALSKRLGGVSLQLQDIGVQLQGGTSALTVFTQQGSQMLSVFGSAGAIAGGVIALGGLLFTTAKNGAEGFRAMIEDADNFTSAAGKATREISSLSNALANLQASQSALSAAKISLDGGDNSFSGVLGSFFDDINTAAGELFGETTPSRSGKK